MAPKITAKEEYLLVEPLTEFWEILEALARLLKMPEYLQKNVIWIFGDGPIKIGYDDLYRLNDFLKENFPEKARPNKKAALVVPSGLGRALATEYTNMVKSIPVEFETFHDLNSAEKWITES